MKLNRITAQNSKRVATQFMFERVQTCTDFCICTERGFYFYNLITIEWISFVIKASWDVDWSE